LFEIDLINSHDGVLCVYCLPPRALGSAWPDRSPTRQAHTIAALVDVRAAIDELDDIAGRLARTATAHGASWGDVASSLGLDADQARSAYGAERRPSR
jgi:hypothetical protein